MGRHSSSSKSRSRSNSRSRKHHKKSKKERSRTPKKHMKNSKSNSRNGKSKYYHSRPQDRHHNDYIPRRSPQRYNNQGFQGWPDQTQNTPFPPPSNEPFKKRFITQVKKIHPFILSQENMQPRSDEEIRAFREKNHIYIRSSHKKVISPFMSFSEAVYFPTCVQDEIERSGFKQPTPIQCQSLPVILEGNDLIGIAQTGSGKTLAFLLPAIVHIMAQTTRRPGDGPAALILAPTRELTLQIMEQFQKFGQRTRLNAACLYGGQDKYIQKSQLRRGAELIIACPGRLIDFLDEGVTNLRRITYLVLDEADRMLDMGFEPQIRKIVKQIRNDRQTLLFSATWPKDVQNLALDFCQENPVHIQIGNMDLTTNKQINQKIYFVRGSDKDLKLFQFGITLSCFMKFFDKRGKVLIHVLD